MQPPTRHRHATQWLQLVLSSCPLELRRCGGSCGLAQCPSVCSVLLAAGNVILKWRNQWVRIDDNSAESLLGPSDITRVIVRTRPRLDVLFTTDGLLAVSAMTSPTISPINHHFWTGMYTKCNCWLQTYATELLLGSALQKTHLAYFQIRTVGSPAAASGRAAWLPANIYSALVTSLD